MLQSLRAGLVQLSQRVVSGSSSTVMSPAGRECKFIQVLEMLVPVMDGNGGQPGFHHDAVGRRPVEGCQGLGIRGAVTKGEAVPEGPDPFLLLAGEDAVAHCLGDSLPESLLQGAVDVLVGGSGALGDGREGLPYGSLVEGVGGCRLGGELDHLGEACLVGLAALGVGALQDAGLLVAVAADAVQGLKEFGEGHGFLFVVCGLGGRGSLFYGGQGYPRWVSVCGVVLWLWKCLDIDLSRDNQGRLCELRSLNGGCRTH